MRGIAVNNIVICCDGTGTEYGTNFVETFVLASNTPGRLAYYDSGVGTWGWAYDEESGSCAR